MINYTSLTTSLEIRISKLPKVLQDLIGEFNIEHRKNTNKIIQQFNSKIHNSCEFCKIPISIDIFCSCDYFINKKCNINNFWCGSCYNFLTIEKQHKYNSDINEYLKNKSILFNDTFHNKLFNSSEWKNAWNQVLEI